MSSVAIQRPSRYGRRSDLGADGGETMRWRRLFDDLEAQVEQADQAALESEVADRTRREVARVRLVDRLRAALGRPVVLRVAGLGRVRAVVEAVGPDWLLVSEREGTETLAALTAVLGVTGLGPAAAVPGSEGMVDAQLGLGFVLRQVARDRSVVTVVLTDGSSVSGSIDRVGADAFDLAEHQRSDADQQPVGQTIPFGAVGALRRTV